MKKVNNSNFSAENLAPETEEWNRGRHWMRKNGGSGLFSNKILLGQIRSKLGRVSLPAMSLLAGIRH
jgi:hypothetical protein